MIGLEPEIAAEYDRVLQTIPNAGERLCPFALTVSDVLRAHFLVANHFYLEGHGLGGVGPKDVGLLQSAVHRQCAAFGGTSKWSELFDICATLFFGLIKNHAFYDANKRTAFLCALFQLYQYKWCPAVPQKEFEDFTVEVADNALGRYARYQSLVKSGDPDPEIKFIAWYLRKNMRKLDRKSHVITYRQLQTILGRHGFRLSNPQDNHIDIVRTELRRPILGILGSAREVEIRVGTIGFPRWTAEVSRPDLKAARELTGLTDERGIDSGAFFHGLDPLQELITTYHEPLMRLSGR